MMNITHNVNRFRIISLFGLMLVLAGLACTPSLEGIFGGTTTEPPGDDAPVAPPGDDAPVAPPGEASLPTPSPTPTDETPVGDGVYERATYDPAAAWGPPDLHDDFGGSNPLFFERTHANSAGWYGSDDRYHLTYTFRDRWVWYWSDVYGGDFYMDVLVINADSCVANDSGGFIFRGHLGADAGYMFGVTCGGGYFIGGTAVPGSDGPICWVGPGTSFGCEPGAAASSVTASEYIHAGRGAANRIGVLARGTTFTYFINGHQVESQTQTSLPFAEGNIALYLGTGQADTAEVMFDDFSLWENP